MFLLSIYAVLCYGSGPRVELGSDNTVEAQTSKQQGNKLKSSSKKKSRADELRLMCTNGKPEYVGDEGEGVEQFPPKIVAMHKVRWNMNLGSENWLCYGGAAGIVRCQEIDFYDL